MRWSFDDYYIGRLKNSTIDAGTRILARPQGMKVQEWYKLAGSIVDILNKEGVQHVG